MIHKLSFIVVSIGPKVLPLSIRSISPVFAYISFPIVVSLCSEPLFLRILKFSLVTVSQLWNINSKTLCFSVVPFPDITLAFTTFPNTASVFFPVEPFPFVNFSITPLKGTFSAFYSWFELTLKFRAIWELFIPLAVLHVFLEFSFKYFTVVVKNDSSSMFFIIFQFSKKNSISVFLNHELFDIYEFKYFTFWMVTVCNPIYPFLIKIVSDRMNRFSITFFIVLLHQRNSKLTNLRELHHFINLLSWLLFFTDLSFFLLLTLKIILVILTLTFMIWFILSFLVYNGEGRKRFENRLGMCWIHGFRLFRNDRKWHSLFFLFNWLIFLVFNFGNFNLFFLNLNRNITAFLYSFFLAFGLIFDWILCFDGAGQLGLKIFISGTTLWKLFFLEIGCSINCAAVLFGTYVLWSLTEIVPVFFDFLNLRVEIRGEFAHWTEVRVGVSWGSGALLASKWLIDQVFGLEMILADGGEFFRRLDFFLVLFQNGTQVNELAEVQVGFLIFEFLCFGLFQDLESVHSGRCFDGGFFMRFDFGFYSDFGFVSLNLLADKLFGVLGLRHFSHGWKPFAGSVRQFVKPGLVRFFRLGWRNVNFL